MGKRFAKCESAAAKCRKKLEFSVSAGAKIAARTRQVRLCSWSVASFKVLAARER